jgi:hypothetical protein
MVVFMCQLHAFNYFLCHELFLSQFVMLLRYLIKSLLYVLSHMEELHA